MDIPTGNRRLKVSSIRAATGFFGFVETLISRKGLRDYLHSGVRALKNELQAGFLGQDVEGDDDSFALAFEWMHVMHVIGWKQD